MRSSAAARALACCWLGLSPLGCHGLGDAIDDVCNPTFTDSTHVMVQGSSAGMLRYAVGTSPSTTFAWTDGVASPALPPNGVFMGTPPGGVAAADGTGTIGWTIERSTPSENDDFELDLALPDVRAHAAGDVLDVPATFSLFDASTGRACQAASTAMLTIDAAQGTWAPVPHYTTSDFSRDGSLALAFNGAGTLDGVETGCTLHVDLQATVSYRASDYGAAKGSTSNCDK